MQHPTKHSATVALATVLLASTATAQAVGVSVSALTPLTISATDGITTSSSTLPAGPLPNHGSLCTFLPNPAVIGACVDWSAGASNTSVHVSLNHALSNAASLPSFQCQAGPHEFLLTFTSAIPRTANLDIARTTQLTTGANWPAVQIDLDNDGLIEVSSLSAAIPTAFPITFGPQPLQVRVVIDAAISGQAAISNYVSLLLRPDNHLTIATPVLGCNPVSPPPPAFLAPAWDNQGVSMQTGASPVELSVVALSLHAQPQLLAMNGMLPCVLLPRPDVVIYVPNGSLQLALPAAIRPASFYAQGVTLTQFGLRVTDGYAVTAN